MFDYLRSQNSLRGRQGLLTADVVSGGAPYSISVRRPDDGLAGAKEPAALKNDPLMSVLEESWIGANESSEDSRRTNLFVQPITARTSKAGGSTLVRTAAVCTRIFLLQGKH